MDDIPVKENEFLPVNHPDAWKMLIVDDEESVHKVTQYALRNYTFENKPIEFLNAYNTESAFNLLKNNNDILPLKKGMKILLPIRIRRI